MWGDRGPGLVQTASLVSMSEILSLTLVGGEAGIELVYYIGCIYSEIYVQYFHWNAILLLIISSLNNF